MRNWPLISIIIIFSFSMTPDETDFESSFFVIEKGSQINIFGTSNVTKFTCCCESTFDPQQFTYTKDKSGYIRFKGTDITVSSSEIDCGNKAMNKDMQQTLQAEEFPFIRVVLKEIYTDTVEDVGIKASPQKIDAVAEITITDVTQSSLISVEAVDLGNNRYNFNSSAVLALSDFGLETPRPLLGLIKVDDNILIDFNLFVNLDPL